MNALRMSAAVAAFVLVAALEPAVAQSPSLQAEILKDWTELKATMDKLVSEMPDERYSFKATAAQQTFGERVLHIAQANVGILQLLGGKAAPPTIAANATTKAAAIKAMDDSFDYGIALLKEQTDQTIMQAIANPPPFLGPSSRARIYTLLVGHTWDIYGQLVVYLRLDGRVPPASQRP